MFLAGINLFGTEEQKHHYISGVAKGEIIGCFGLTEPDAGSDASYVQTTAVRDGDNYVINGKKHYITNAAIAHACILFAKTDPSLPGTKGLSAFIVDTSTPGFKLGKLENKMGLRGLMVSEIEFENMRIPASCRLGEENKGFKVAMQILDAGRVGIATQGLGLAKGAFKIALDHVHTRQQFGPPIFANQFIQFHMVDNLLIIEQAELMLQKAAWEQDNHIPTFGITAAKAKLLCTDAAMTVTTNMVQMMGGKGYMKENHVERMMRDAKITQIYEGTNQVQRMVISNSLKHKLYTR